MISKAVLRHLKVMGPLTADELAVRIEIPAPHVRAAIAELCFRDRLVTSVDGQRVQLGEPPADWPQAVA